MFNSAFIRNLSILLILLLTGCETLTQSRNEMDWQQHQQQLQQLTNFIAKGKIRYTDPQNNQSLNFALIQKNNRSELRLFTPFQTVMKLIMTPKLTVVTVDGKDYKGQEANKLVYELTGLNVPVAQLPDWIKGLPTQADYIEYNNSNTVSRIEKRLNGSMWTLEYIEYADTSRPNFILPKQMQLHQNNTNIKINLNDWDLDNDD